MTIQRIVRVEFKGLHKVFLGDLIVSIFIGKNAEIIIGDTAPFVGISGQEYKQNK
jgi:hypothetical protein